MKEVSIKLITELILDKDYLEYTYDLDMSEYDDEKLTKWCLDYIKRDINEIIINSDIEPIITITN